MYGNFNADWHNLITDGLTPQECVICPGNWDNSHPLWDGYSGLCGDIETSGVQILDEAQTYNDPYIGLVSGKTLTASLINRGGDRTVDGELSVYIGVRTSRDEMFLDAVNAFISLPNGDYITADGESIALNGETLENGNFTALICDYFVHPSVGYNYVCYAFSETNPIVIVGEEQAAAPEIIPFTPTYWEKDRLRQLGGGILSIQTADGSRKIQRFTTDDDKGDDKGFIDTFDMCPMGTFYAEANTYKNEGTIHIENAPDGVKLLDKDCTDIVRDAMGVQKSGKWIDLIREIADEVGVEVSDNLATFLGNATYGESQNLGSRFTFRQFLSWVSEYFGMCAYMNRENELDFYKFGTGSEKDYPVADTNIALGGYKEAVYTVLAVDCVNDGYRVYPEDSPKANPYVMETASPFAWSYDDAWEHYVVNGGLGYAPYVPMSANVINADPSFEAGRLFKIKGKNVPVFTQTITWNGFTSAVYEATGGRTRNDNTEDNYEGYNTIKGIHTSPIYLAMSSSYDVEVKTIENQYETDFSAYLIVLTEIRSLNEEQKEFVVASEVVPREVAYLNEFRTDEYYMNRLGFYNPNAWGAEEAIRGYWSIGHDPNTPTDLRVALSTTHNTRIYVYGLRW